MLDLAYRDLRFPRLGAMRGGGGFSPAAQMFGAGEPGYAYRLNPAICFTDLLGTTQALPADAVALRLDESGRNNHATQATLALRPILGRKPKRGAVNRLIYTEDFANAAWVAFNSTKVTLGFRETTANTEHYFEQLVSLSGNCTATFEVRSLGRDVIRLALGTSSGTLGVVYTFSTGAFSSVGTAITAHTAENLGDGYHRITLTSNAGSNRFRVQTTDGGVGSFVGDIAKGIDVRNIQLELGSAATAYQRVVSQFDITEPGQRDCWYLFHGGAANPRWMQTASIDFTATDKVTGVVGIRKQSDAVQCIAVEMGSTGSSGLISMQAPSFSPATNRYGFISWGSAVGIGGQALDASALRNAPSTNIVTGLGDISGERSTLRIDSTQVAQSTANQGTGNYGNYPVYIGCRGGTSLYLNGEDYGQIVRGAATDLALLEQAERYIAENTPEVTL